MISTALAGFSWSGGVQNDFVSARAFISENESLIPLLKSVREHAAREGLPFAGSVSAQDAWLLLTTASAIIVDVRTAEERKFVGYVPGTLHVPWMVGTSLARNPDFTRDLERVARKQDIILLLCRSGNRSAQAAEAATRAGFTQVFNICQGFEGELDGHGRRGFCNGWRHQNLPWQQD